jgi:CheY-like chemotaxis protein
MNILISTTDRARLYLVEKLSIKLGHEIVEAAHGLDALDRLTQQPIDLLMLDEPMPVMGALETLAILREAPEFSHLPVIVFSHTVDERVVQQLVALGVSDIVQTQAAPERLIARVTSILESTHITKTSASPHRKNLSGRPPRQQTALIVDGDAEYCTLFENAVRARCNVVTARSGAKALEVCRLSPPDIVLIGTNLGILGREPLVHQLRAIQHSAFQIVALSRKSEAEAVRASQLFDEVIARAYVPATIVKDLTYLLKPTTPFGSLSALVPNLRTIIVTAAEQTFAMMLKTDVELTDPSPLGNERLASASLTIANAPFVATVRIRFDMSSGRALAAAFLEGDGNDLGEDDILSVAGELANVLSGRVTAAFRQRKPGWVVGLPTVDAKPAAGDGTAAQEEPEISLHFHAIDRPIVFQVDLSVEALVADRVAADAETGVTMLRTDD